MPEPAGQESQIDRGRVRCVSGFFQRWSNWAGPLSAFAFVAAMVVVGWVLLRPDTWRREIRRQDTHIDEAGVRERPADELTQVTECFSAVRGEGAVKGALPLRREPLARWSEPSQNVGEAGLWAWGERGGPYAFVMIERSAERPGTDQTGSWGLELTSLADGPLEVEASNVVRARNAISREPARSRC